MKNDSDFTNEIKTICNYRLRIAAYIAVSTFSLFGVLDYFLFKQNLTTLWLCRIVFVVGELGILILTYVKNLKRFVFITSAIAWIIGGAVISTMVMYTGGHQSPYYAGLSAITVALGLLMPWNGRWTALTCVLIYFVYLTPIFFSDKITNLPIFINNNFFLVCTMVIATISSHVQYKLRQREFAQREQLKDLDKMKLKFFSNVSHELRTPITLNIVPLEAMLSGAVCQIPAELKGHLSMMYTNSIRLLKLVNNLLDVMKLEAGKELKMAYQKIDLRRFLEGLLESVSLFSKKKNIDIESRFDKDLPEIYIDKDKIERVVLNLLSNALKFTKDGGKITLSAALSALNGLRNTLRDTSVVSLVPPGISPYLNCLNIHAYI